MQLVYEKAISEPQYGPLYAKLAELLSQKVCMVFISEPFLSTIILQSQFPVDLYPVMCGLKVKDDRGRRSVCFRRRGPGVGSGGNK